MFRQTIFVVATVAAIGAAALIPPQLPPVVAARVVLEWVITALVTVTGEAASAAAS